MYKHNIGEMEDAGVAVRRVSPVWMDRSGNIVDEFTMVQDLPRMNTPKLIAVAVGGFSKGVTTHLKEMVLKDRTEAEDF